MKLFHHSCAHVNACTHSSLMHVHSCAPLQSWKDNMGTTGKVSITSSKSDYTMVSFKPDLSKFKMTHLDKDTVGLMTRRAYDIAGCTRGVGVTLNGKKLPVSGGGGGGVEGCACEGGMRVWEWDGDLCVWRWSRDLSLVGVMMERSQLCIR